MPFGVVLQFMGLSTTTNKFVLFGGYNNTGYKDIVWEYDPELNVYVI